VLPRSVTVVRMHGLMGVTVTTIMDDFGSPTHEAGGERATRAV
jgi:hypothetical protein